MAAGNHMVSSAYAALTVEAEQSTDLQAGPDSAPAYTVGVRLKYGEEMDGLDIQEDGLTFRAFRPMQPGQLTELILCRGSILVDAVIIHCRPIPEVPGTFRVQVRYHEASRALSALIREEFLRISGGPVAL
jgi:hypothetical protein